MESILDSYITNYIKSVQMVPYLLQSQISTSLHYDSLQSRIMAKIDKLIVKMSTSRNFEKSLSEIISSLLVLNEIFDGKISDINDLEDNLEKISLFLLSSKATVLADDAQKLKSLAGAFRTKDLNENRHLFQNRATSDSLETSCNPSQNTDEAKTKCSDFDTPRQQRVHRSSSDLLLRGTKWINVGKRKQHRAPDIRSMKSSSSVDMPIKTPSNSMHEKETAHQRNRLPSFVRTSGHRLISTSRLRPLQTSSRLKSYRDRNAARLVREKMVNFHKRRISEISVETKEDTIRSNSDDCDTASDDTQMGNPNRSSRSSSINPKEKKIKLETSRYKYRKVENNSEQVSHEAKRQEGSSSSHESSSSELPSSKGDNIPNYLGIKSNQNTPSSNTLNNARKSDSVLKSRNLQRRTIKFPFTNTSKPSDIRSQAISQSAKRISSLYETRSSPVHSKTHQDNSASLEESSDSGNDATPAVREKLYCICKKVSFGEMIACDNRRCSVEWFHFSCVDIRVQPKGKWFCPQCRGETSKCRRLDA